MHPTRPPPTRRRELATALREALELVPWSLRSLGRSLGRSHATVSDYKTGTTPTPEILGQLGELLEERGRALVAAGRELQRFAARRLAKGDTTPAEEFTAEEIRAVQLRDLEMLRGRLAYGDALDPNELARLEELTRTFPPLTTNPPEMP